MKTLSSIIILLTFFLIDPMGCEENNKSSKEETRPYKTSHSNGSLEETKAEGTVGFATDNTGKDQMVGVYMMPSWNTSADPNKEIDSFWSCLTGRDRKSVV